MPADAPQTTSAQPLVVISYSKAEEKWKDQLVSLFPTSVVQLMFNRVDDQPQSALSLVSQLVKIDEKLKEKQVLVMLLSPSYLRTSWVVSEQTNSVLDLERQYGLKILPVLLRDCPWDEIPFLRNRELITNDGKPIAEASRAEQTSALGNVASRILDFAGIADPLKQKTSKAAPSSAASMLTDTVSAKELEKFRWSTEVQKIVNRAQILGLDKDGRTTISSMGLLFAFAEVGRENPSEAKTPQFLWSEITAKGVTFYENAFTSAFPMGRTTRSRKGTTRPSLRVTREVTRVFERAARRSRQTIKLPPPAPKIRLPLSDGLIAARHLLAAFLTLERDDGTGVFSVLSTITNLDALRQRYFHIIEKAGLRDDLDEWRSILQIEARKTKLEAEPVLQSDQEIQGHIEGIPVSVRSAALDEDIEVDAELLGANQGSQKVVSEDFLKAPVTTETMETVADGGSVVPSPPPPPHGTGYVDLLAATDDPAQTPSQSFHADHEQSLPHPQTTIDAQLHESAVAEDEGDDLKPILAGFATDYWGGKDLLDIEQDVNALASLVAAWSVEPPLSIGLFGDWGSGKSHFMRQMRQQVEKLSRNARKSPKKQNEIGYYKNIVQIEFNAWHYIEGNLWASLVDHIFANLRVSEKEKLSIVEARRDELMTNLGVKKEIEAKLKSKIEDRTTQLRTKQKEATDLARDAQQKKATATQALAGFRDEVKENLDQLELPIAFSKEDKDLLERIGIKPSNLETAGDVRTQYYEIKSGWNGLIAQGNLFRKDPRRWPLAAVALLTLGLGYLLTKVANVDAVPAWLASIVAFLGTGYAAIKPALDQYRKGVKSLEDKDRAIELERQRRIAELQGEVSALTKTVMDAEGEAESIENEIVDLNYQIQTTTTTKILAEFIEDRAAASDYRRHLGLLALIRRDFEKLRDLFDQQRIEEKEGQETHHQNRINRIILYIDDLDRCGPQRVVEVLQAIHLLLAFPIFVVVVGVDARWVTRSLQESYEWLRLEEDETRKKDTDTDEDDRSGEGATPHDYLEKIFQIPFWLRPMEEEQCKSFIEGLTEQVRYRPPEEGSGLNQHGNGEEVFQGSAVLPEVEAPAQKDVPSGNGHPEVNQSADGGNNIESEMTPDAASANEHEALNTLDTSSATTVETPAPVTNLTNLSESSSTDEQIHDPLESKMKDSDQKPDEDVYDDDDHQPIDLSPQSLTLGEKEIEYMTSLAKLIGRSPRAVKRFLNCYRLIKVSLAPAHLKKFVQDGASYEYRAVMILLGVITGTPTASLYVIEELENWTWEIETAATMTDFLNKLEGNSDLKRTADWSRLKSFLSGFDNASDSAKIFAALKGVTPRVSRFSFRIARAEAAGPKRVSATPQSKPKGPQTGGPVA